MGIPAGLHSWQYSSHRRGPFQLGLALGYTINDQSQGTAIGVARILPYAGRPTHDLAYRSVDLRLEKILKFARTSGSRRRWMRSTSSTYTNDSGYDGSISTLATANPKFGQPISVLENSAKRLQVALWHAF